MNGINEISPILDRVEVGNNQENPSDKDILSASERAEILFGNFGEDILNNESNAVTNVIDYFGGEKISHITESMGEIGLHLEELLIGYKVVLEEELVSLTEEQKEKIITAIVNKISSVYEDIDDSMKTPNNRWIVNKMLLSELSFINDELLPSLKVRELLKNGAEIPEEYNKIVIGGKIGEGSEILDGNNKNFINIESVKREIEEVLEAKVTEDGDLDEGFFAIQEILDRNNSVHRSLLHDMGVEVDSVTFLSNSDLETERKAERYLLEYIMEQTAVETVGGPAGMVASAGSELYDGVGDGYTALEMRKKTGDLPADYTHPKDWGDRGMALMSMLPFVTQIKGALGLEKLVNGTKGFEKMSEATIARKIEEAKHGTDYIENLGQYLMKKGEHPKKALNIMEDFRDKLDPLHLIGNQNRINGMSKIVESQCAYILRSNGKVNNLSEFVTILADINRKLIAAEKTGYMKVDEIKDLHRIREKMKETYIRLNLK